MMGAKQVKFCGAVARALLIGVKFDGFDPHNFQLPFLGLQAQDL